jgi:hypothetical protein
MMTFRKKYFGLTLILFIIEVVIASFVHDRIVRPYIGDFLVVIFLYCLIRSFFTFSVFNTAIGVLIFAYLVEILQYCDLIQKLQLQNSKLANLILGNLFEWIDMVAYTFGIAVVLLWEKTITPRN